MEQFAENEQNLLVKLWDILPDKVYTRNQHHCGKDMSESQASNNIVQTVKMNSFTTFYPVSFDFYLRKILYKWTIFHDVSRNFQNGFYLCLQYKFKLWSLFHQQERCQIQPDFSVIRHVWSLHTVVYPVCEKYMFINNLMTFLYVVTHKH